MTEREPHVIEHNNKVLENIVKFVNELDFAIVGGELKVKDLNGLKETKSIAGVYEHQIDIDHLKAKEEVRIGKRKLDVIEAQKKKQALDAEQKKKEAREKLETEFAENWKRMNRALDCDYCIERCNKGWRNEEACEHYIDICDECKSKYTVQGKNPPLPPPQKSK